MRKFTFCVALVGLLSSVPVLSFGSDLPSRTVTNYYASLLNDMKSGGGTSFNTVSAYLTATNPLTSGAYGSKSSSSSSSFANFFDLIFNH